MIFVFINFLLQSLCAKVCHNLLLLLFLFVVVTLNSHQTSCLNHTKFKVKLSKPFVNLTEIPIELSSSSNYWTISSSNTSLIKSHSQPAINIVNLNNEEDNFLKHNFSGHHSSRVKRGIIQLASMIKCVSGCKPIQYKGYGCFCGLFGSGKPVDAIDRCCLKHDWCYSNAPCHQLLLYMTPYHWECAAPGYANCAHSDYIRSKDKCAISLCECDRIFAECISQFPCPSYKAPCPYKQMVLAVVGK